MKYLWLIIFWTIILFVVWNMGNKSGKNEEKSKNDKNKLDQVASAKRIDDLPDSAIDKLPSIYD